MIVQFVLG